MPTFKIHVLTFNSINSLSDFSLFIAFTSKVQTVKVHLNLALALCSRRSAILHPVRPSTFVSVELSFGSEAFHIMGEGSMTPWLEIWVA